MAALSEVMKMLSILAPWRADSLGVSVSMLLTQTLEGLHATLIASGAHGYKGS
jgi:hypothetical protein